MDATGVVRPHWRPFLAAFAELPAAEQTQRAERLNRRVREMGIAHDIFADPTSPGKRWEVDLVPLIFSSSEWQRAGDGAHPARPPVQRHPRRRLR